MAITLKGVMYIILGIFVLYFLDLFLTFCDPFQNRLNFKKLFHTNTDLFNPYSRFYFNETITKKYNDFLVFKTLNFFLSPINIFIFLFNYLIKNPLLNLPTLLFLIISILFSLFYLIIPFIFLGTIGYIIFFKKLKLNKYIF